MSKELDKPQTGEKQKPIDTKTRQRYYKKKKPQTKSLINSFTKIIKILNQKNM